MTSKPPPALFGSFAQDARELESETEELESPDQYMKDVQERKNEIRTMFE
jgi:hypothetical protein